MVDHDNRTNKERRGLRGNGPAHEKIVRSLSEAAV